MLEPVYRYRAVPHRIIDGDTYELNIDLGLKVWAHVPVRLFGWSCAELREPYGLEAKAMADQLLRAAGSIIVETEKDRQTFARWLARVYVDGEELGAKLAAAGLAYRSLTLPSLHDG